MTRAAIYCLSIRAPMHLISGQLEVEAGVVQQQRRRTGGNSWSAFPSLASLRYSQVSLSTSCLSPNSTLHQPRSPTRQLTRYPLVLRSLKHKSYWKILPNPSHILIDPYRGRQGLAGFRGRSFCGASANNQQKMASMGRRTLRTIVLKYKQGQKLVLSDALAVQS